MTLLLPQRLKTLSVVEALSPQERIEARIKATEKLGSSHLANVEAILTRPEGDGSYLLKQRFYGANLVTDDGDIYYAQQGAGGAVTDDFAGANGRCVLTTTTDTPAKGDTYADVLGPIAASNKGHTSTYPKQNDLDADNTGKGTKVTTYKFNWLTTDFSDNDIEGGCIHAGGGTPGGNILCYWQFAAPFAKTSADTLTLYVNHAFLG